MSQDAIWVLWRTAVLTPVVRETAKVTSMVFAILIGSQMLNLVVISFGGEHYIQQFLRSFDNEMVVFLVVITTIVVNQGIQFVENLPAYLDDLGQTYRELDLPDWLRSGTDTIIASAHGCWRSHCWVAGR